MLMKKRKNEEMSTKQIKRQPEARWIVEEDMPLFKKISSFILKPCNKCTFVYKNPYRSKRNDDNSNNLHDVYWPKLVENEKEKYDIYTTSKSYWLFEFYVVFLFVFDNLELSFSQRISFITVL